MNAKFLHSVSLCEQEHIFVRLWENRCVVILEEVQKSARSSTKEVLYEGKFHCALESIRIDGYLHLIQATSGDQRSGVQVLDARQDFE